MKSALIALIAVALTSCAIDQRHSPQGAPEDTCGLIGLSDLLGKVRSDTLVAEVAQRSGGRRVRWIRPDDVVTMDYSRGRLNIHLNARDKIVRLSCG